VHCAEARPAWQRPAVQVSPDAQVALAVQLARQRPLEQVLPVAHWLSVWQSAVAPTPHAVPAPMRQRPLVQVWPLPQSDDDAHAAAHWPATQMDGDAQSDAWVQLPLPPGVPLFAAVLPPFGLVLVVVLVDPWFGLGPGAM
jgi:hypothetical protein